MLGGGEGEMRVEFGPEVDDDVGGAGLHECMEVEKGEAQLDLDDAAFEVYSART